MRLATALVWILSSTALAVAQPYKQLPPPGIEIDPAIRQALTQRIDQLQAQIDAGVTARVVASCDVHVGEAARLLVDPVAI